MSRVREHFTVPEVQSGSVLDPTLGWFSVVLPIARTNLVANPSVETNTTGYTDLGGGTVIARSLEQQRRGAYSLKCTPANTALAGYYYGTVSLAASTLYGVSFDFYGAAGVQYVVTVRSTGGTIMSRQHRFYGKGRWTREVLMYEELSTTTRRIYFQTVSASVRPFYMDGLQGEPCTALRGASTYLDGDQVGFVRGQAAYYWTGTPHASTSVRSGQTRAGGTLMRLDQLGFSLMAVIGLGMAPIRNVALDYGYLDGASYERTVTDPRQFTLVGTVEGHSMLDLQLKRKALIDAFKPDLTGLQQPLVLQYQYADDCGASSGETFNLVCNFQSPGLNGNIDNGYQERLGLPFTMYLPFITDDGSQAVELDPVAALNSGPAAQRVTGIWEAAGGSGFSVGAEVFAIVTDNARGRVYYAGSFSTLNGVTVNNVGYLDLFTGTYHAMGSGTVGVSGGTVYTLAVDADGNVWVGGDYTSAGGSAAKGLARYNRSANTWTAFNPATSTFSFIWTIAIDNDGIVYGGGEFTNWNADANQDNIWSYDGSVFAPLGVGLNARVRKIVAASNNLLFVGGNFTLAGGLSLNRIASWRKDVPSWNPLDGFGVQGVDAEVLDMSFDAPSFVLHVVGNFVSPGGLTGSPYYARWAFNNLWANGAGKEVLFPPTAVHWAKDNDGVYLGFVGGVGLSEDQVLLVTSDVGPAISLFTNSSIAQIETIAGPDNIGNLYIGASINPIVIDVAGTVTLTNEGNAKVYPTVRLKGPGKLISMTNITTGIAIYFNNYVMQTGESLLLKLQPGQLSFTSSFNGNILSSILFNSGTVNFFLQPGENVISLFVAEDTPAETLIEWTPLHWSIDSALP